MTDTIRVTLVFPKESWEEVKRLVPSGDRSRFVVEATKREIRRRQRLESIEQLQAIQKELKKKYGEMPRCAEEIQDMREERDAEITGLR
jgi:seryl-tRNA synthetase